MKCGAVAWLFCVGVGVALALRAGDLALRPLHNDEAINAFKLQKLRVDGVYAYDPHEYHGPVLYYVSLPVVRLASWLRPEAPDEAGMRWVAVVFGIGLILLLPLLGDGLGWPSALAAGGLTAVSPAMVYYSRYYIHELLLVFFTFLAAVAWWRYTRKPYIGWAILAGAAIGFMYATKETFVFAVFAAALAWPLALAWEVGTSRRPPESGFDRSLPRVVLRRLLAAVRAVPRSHWMGALIAGLAVFVVFFTSFFSHASGPVDALRSYVTWGERAGGASPHNHPWFFYLERLGWFHRRGSPVWSEAGVLVLAVIGGVTALRGRLLPEQGVRLGRFLVFYTVVLAAIYSALPYKTPWCLLGFYHGAILLAGVGVTTLLSTARSLWIRGIVAGLLATLAGHLGWQAWLATREFAADFRNPYVYGHTSADIRNLVEQVKELAEVAPEGLRMPIQVGAPASDYWPLPWYLRQFQQVGWWDRVPEDPLAPVVVLASSLRAALDERSSQAWRMVGTFELRPRVFIELYVEAGLWKRFLDARAARP